MADQPNVAPLFPAEALPTVFADGVANLAQSGEVVKFYLTRTDPSTNIPSESKVQIFAQVVMSMTGFIDAAHFFEQALDNYVKNGVISQERRNDARVRYNLAPK